MSKILLIDNQPMIRFATRVLLEREGYDIVGETENGVEGLSLARSLRPDLVILDIAVPKLDGMEVLTRLAAMDVNLKLLVLTSLPAALYANRCLQAGATGYLSKQEQAVSLIAATKSVLSGYSLFPSTVHLPVPSQAGEDTSCSTACQTGSSRCCRTLPTARTTRRSPSSCSSATRR